MKTSEVLNTAADLIEERGWDKGSGWLTSSSGARAPLCLEGGIMAAQGITFPANFGDPELNELAACPAYRAVQAHLSTAEGLRLYDWNDAYLRTATEVVEVLRAVAVIEAAREESRVEVSA